MTEMINDLMPLLHVCAVLGVMLVIAMLVSLVSKVMDRD